VINPENYLEWISDNK